MRTKLIWATLIILAGCSGNKEKKVSGNIITADLPVFSLAPSEYPSWSVFMVAAKGGLINPQKGGEQGSLEKKWGVDIVLQVKDYDSCITMYGSGAVDAVCITNIDALNPALGRASTAILPTSTSVGADKIIAVGDVKTPADLKNLKVYGLAKSVSQYVFVRGLQKSNLNYREFAFENLDPAAAATALQTSNSNIKAICVWNPFALQTLRTNKQSKVVFDSSLIPEEVIDMVVVANDSLAKTGGPDFARCICDIFYTVNGKMADPKTANLTLKALGEDFSNLPVEDMKICVKETSFYSNRAAGVSLFSSDTFKKTMKTVVKTCQDIEILDKNKSPTIGYNQSGVQLNFDTTYMQNLDRK